MADPTLSNNEGSHVRRQILKPVSLKIKDWDLTEQKGELKFLRF